MKASSQHPLKVLWPAQILASASPVNKPQGDDCGIYSPSVYQASGGLSGARRCVVGPGCHVWRLSAAHRLVCPCLYGSGLRIRGRSVMVVGLGCV